MHLDAGHVTAFSRVPLSRGKTLCDSELQDRAKVCAGPGVFGGAVEFEKPLRHDDNRQECCHEPCATDKTFVQSIDALLRAVLLIELKQSNTGIRWPMFVCFSILQLNRAVTTPAITRESIATLHSPECFSATPVRIVSEHLPRMNAGRARGLSSVAPINTCKR